MSDFSCLFLGTCACDFSPKLSEEFKNAFDFDARRASSMLLNRRFLIDCGPHCCDSLAIAGAEKTAIGDLFLTHLHSDHFDVKNIRRIAKGRREPLRLWVREDARLPKIENVSVCHMTDQVRYELDDGTAVVGLKANHDPDSAPQWLLFERNGTSLLYALDGAWYLTGTYNYLKDKRLSMLVMDATVGDYRGDYRLAEHNSIPMIRLMLPSLKKTGIIDGKTQIYFSHIAPSLHRPHNELVQTARRIGAAVAYDGLTVEL